jgi:hypothetical protein
LIGPASVASAGAGRGERMSDKCACCKTAIMKGTVVCALCLLRKCLPPATCNRPIAVRAGDWQTNIH